MRFVLERGVTKVESRTRLGQLVDRKRWTTRVFVGAFKKTAAAMVEAGAINEQAEISWAQARRWINGETKSKPYPIACQVLEEMFKDHHVTAEELFGPPAHEELVVSAPQAQEAIFPMSLGSSPGWPETLNTTVRIEEMTRMAAAESAAFGAFAEQSNVGPVTIEQLRADLIRIVTDYPNRPIGPLFAELRELCKRVFKLLEGHQPPHLTRELYVIAGSLCAVMSNASFDLGDIPAAETQARTAWLSAELAQHNGLRAWVRGLQALMAYYDDRFKEAAEYAQNGWQYIPESGSARVRLASVEARALARMRDERGAADALVRAESARDQIRGPDDPGGMMEFPVAKQLYSAANTLLWLGGDANFDEAERLASESVQLYMNDPPEQRRIGEMSLARLDLAVSHLHRRDLESAAPHVELVLETGGNRRIESVGRRLYQISIALERPHFQTSSLALSLHDRIRESPVASIRALNPGMSR